MYWLAILAFGPEDVGAAVGTVVAAERGVLRRIFALAGFVVVLIVALLLLYRVYIHHTRAAPYVDDDRPMVRMDVNFSGVSS